MSALPTVGPLSVHGTEPITRALLREMIMAMDAGHSDAYWDALERFMAIHSAALDVAAKEAK